MTNGSEKIHGLTFSGDYDRLMPPDDSVTVYVDIMENIIRKVNEFETTLTMETSLSVFWEDTRISVSEKVDFIKFKNPEILQHIWTPSIEATNIKQSMSISSLTEDSLGR